MKLINGDHSRGVLKRLLYFYQYMKDQPSLYVATKKSNELMAHVYSFLYRLQIICLIKI